jgi:hypothetical protein
VHRGLKDLLDIGVGHIGVGVESPAGTLGVHDGQQVAHY